MDNNELKLEEEYKYGFKDEDVSFFRREISLTISSVRPFSVL